MKIGLRPILAINTETIMVRNSKPRGRPGRSLAPRINARAEEVARYVLSKPLPSVDLQEQAYACLMCKKPVCFPEILYEDGKCENCTERRA